MPNVLTHEKQTSDNSAHSISNIWDSRNGKKAESTNMNVSFLKLLLNINFLAHCDITSYNTECTIEYIDTDFRCGGLLVCIHFCFIYNSIS